MDVGEAEVIEFVTAKGALVEEVEQTEEALNLVAPRIASAVVSAGSKAGGSGRDDGLVAELAGQAPSGVIPMGEVPDQVRSRPSRRSSFRPQGAARR